MAHKLPNSGYILGLDVGEKRIGVAVSSVIAQLPQPLNVIVAGDTAIQSILEVIKVEAIEMVVIGVPRNLDGQETAQSASIREFARSLEGHTSVPIIFADESLSSVRAEDMQQATFKNVSSDSLAACFILEEYFETYRNTQQAGE